MNVLTAFVTVLLMNRNTRVNGVSRYARHDCIWLSLFCCSFHASVFQAVKYLNLGLTIFNVVIILMFCNAFLKIPQRIW